MSDSRTPPVRHQRTAISTGTDNSPHRALTVAVRELAEAQMGSNVDESEALAIAAEIRQIGARLRRTFVGGAEEAGLEPGSELVGDGNATAGARNPFAPMVAGAYEVDDVQHVHRTLNLGSLYEGPRGLVHGGVIAAVLDHIVGEAAVHAGGAAMTASLAVRYVKPTPLGEVSVEGWVVHANGRKIAARGLLRDALGNVTVEAEALMIRPRRN